MTILSKESENELTARVLALVESSITNHEKRKEEMKRYLRIDEATVYCGVSRQTLDRWVIQHGLKQIKIGQIISYDRKDLDDLMARFKI